MSIYKPCGIRGRVAAELSPDLYRRWGLALGQQVGPAAKFLVGGDVRASTPPLLAGLAEGLCQSGVDVVELGLLPTPMICYARSRLRAAGCAIVTASHHPAEINGLKWMVGDLPPTPEEVVALRRAAEDPQPAATASHPGTAARPLDVSFDYVAWLQETWVDALGAQCHVVLDPMHGCWAARARRYLQAIFPQALFSTIHDSPQADLAGGSPDCSQPDNLNELCEAVYRERANLGLAFDGDGDRIALVDNEGMVLTAEEATWVMLQTFGPELHGERFVYDVKFSDRVAEAARELGAEPVVERSGRAFLRTRMSQANALFGAGMSGHYFHRALEGGADGLFTACRLIAYLARAQTDLAELRRSCPPVYMTPELRIPLAPQEQHQVIEQVRTAWAGFPQSAVDGVRVDTPAGWALVRSSATEAALSFRFESLDWHGLEALVNRFCDALPAVGDELWARYHSAMGTAAD